MQIIQNFHTELNQISLSVSLRKCAQGKPWEQSQEKALNSSHLFLVFEWEPLALQPGESMLPSSCKFLMWKEVKTTSATAEALLHRANISLRKSPLKSFHWRQQGKEAEAGAGEMAR